MDEISLCILFYVQPEDGF